MSYIAWPAPMGKLFTCSWYVWSARPICFRLLVHCMRRAASRAAWTAGNSRAIRTAMIAITTSSSISVNPRDLRLGIEASQLEETEMRDFTCEAETQSKADLVVAATDLAR